MLSRVSEYFELMSEVIKIFGWGDFSSQGFGLPKSEGEERDSYVRERK